MYTERFYRDLSATTRWHTFRIKAESTDLYVRACRDLSKETEILAREARMLIREHISRVPEFMTSLAPMSSPGGEHPLIETMYAASTGAGVGPMASVAGAVAEFVGRGLAERSRELIVENGGDIWLHITEPVIMAVYAGNSPFSGKLRIVLRPGKTPCGICTSSGRIGPSLSFGRSHAATVIANDAALADAAATLAGNMTRTEADLESAAEYAMGIGGVRAVMIVLGGKSVLQGDIELI